MSGRRTTKQELEQIETSTKEGPTTREISKKLNRSEAAIRNLRYKKRLAPILRNETAVLLQQKGSLISSIRALQNQKDALVNELNSLGKEKKTLEEALRTDEVLLEQTLVKALINLKLQKPELFYMNTQDQISSIVSLIIKGLELSK